MLANQTECSRLEQRFGIKFLMAGKGKTYEIYRRMYKVYGKTYFSKKCLQTG